MLTKALNVQKISTLLGHSDCIYTLAAYGLGRPKCFFSAGADGMLVEWNLDQNQENVSNGVLFAKFDNAVYAIAVDEENKQIIAGQNTEGIFALGLQTKAQLATFATKGHTIFCITLVEENIWVGLSGGMIQVLERQTLKHINTIKIGTSANVRSFGYDDKLGIMCVGASDGMLRLYDAVTLALITDAKADNHSVFSIIIDDDGNYLTAGREAHIRVWRFADNLLHLDIDVAAHLYAVNSMALSDNGKILATCSMDKSIKVWAAHQMRLLGVIDKAKHAGHGTSVNKVIWLPYNGYLVSCSDDRSISVWDIGG